MTDAALMIFMDISVPLVYVNVPVIVLIAMKMHIRSDL